MIVLQRIKKLFSSKEDPLSRFTEKLLCNKCRMVRITPTVYVEGSMGRSTRFNPRYKYALRFEGIIERGKKGAVKYRETYFSSYDAENKRKNILELFLYAERKKEELKKILPDLIVVVIGMDGYPINDRMVGIIKEEAQLKNAAIL